MITATESENGISPSGQVAFASDWDGIPQVFLLNLSDSSIAKLTNLAGGACQPDWSPSGDKLVIVSPCSGDSTPHKNSSLFIINADGSGLTGIKTMPGGDYDPDWSPDGSRIVFTSLRDSSAITPKTHLYVYDFADDKASRLLKTNPNQQSPRFSPDGSRIVFEMFLTNNPQLFIMNSDGSEPIQFMPASTGPARFPNWSPGGNSLTFTLPSQSPGIFIKSITSPDSKAMPVSGVVSPAKNSVFSPDGKWLLFESDGDLWVIPVTGGKATNLTGSQSKEFDAAWKP